MAQKAIRAGELARARQTLDEAFACDATCGGLGAADYGKWWRNLPERDPALAERLRKAGIGEPSERADVKSRSPYGQ